MTKRYRNPDLFFVVGGVFSRKHSSMRYKHPKKTHRKTNRLNYSDAVHVGRARLSKVFRYATKGKSEAKFGKCALKGNLQWTTYTEAEKNTNDTSFKRVNVLLRRRRSAASRLIVVTHASHSAATRKRFEKRLFRNRQFFRDSPSWRRDRKVPRVA